MLSNYEFKNKEEIFMNCNFVIKKNTNLNTLEIEPSIRIASISIYLDKASLFYMLDALDQIKGKKEKEKENEKDKNKKEINLINDIENHKNSQYIINNTNIECFFLYFNYATNKDVDSKKYSNYKILEYLPSLSNLTIDFKEYKNENNKLPLYEAIKNIYEFYYNDIMTQIKAGKFVPALPFFNQLFSVVDGAFDIVREPVQKYNNNESIIEGFVLGTKSLAINTFSLFTYLGESIFNSFGCIPKNEENNMDINFCRGLRHSFNEKNKEIEEFYLK